MSREQLTKLLDAYLKAKSCILGRQPDNDASSPAFRQNIAHIVAGVIKFDPLFKNAFPSPQTICNPEKLDQNNLNRLYMRLGTFFEQYY